VKCFWIALNKIESFRLIFILVRNETCITMTHTISVHADSDLVALIDREASKHSLSRSKFVVQCIHAYFRSNHADDVKSMKLQTDLTLKEETLKLKEESLKQRDERISELQDTLNFLRHEYSILSQRLLPPPKQPLLQRIKAKLRINNLG
jgi:hypothetical protein